MLEFYGVMLIIHIIAEASGNADLFMICVSGCK